MNTKLIVTNLSHPRIVSGIFIFHIPESTRPAYVNRLTASGAIGRYGHLDQYNYQTYGLIIANPLRAIASVVVSFTCPSPICYWCNDHVFVCYDILQKKETRHFCLRFSNYCLA